MNRIPALILVAIFLVNSSFAQEPIFAHYINVGQGDSTLFEFPGCGVMLIDAGQE